MTTLYQQVARLASITEPVVISGPSGSGKELVARELHFGGSRCDGPFVATNAASMPVSLAEDELFGHEKGAFTGAHSQRQGCIEKAHNGTLFLDEIGDLDPQIQAKLLRVLENGTFSRLGSNQEIKVSVRLITATHKDLESLVNEGTFRHDLWYRLCAFVLKIPALSQRTEDIHLLAEALLAQSNMDMGTSKQFDSSALSALGKGTYAGNIRELKHIVTRAVVFSTTDILTEKDIFTANTPLQSANEHQNTFAGCDYTSLDFKNARDQFEKDYLSTMLTRHDGNITATSNKIGMAQSNLSRKLKELGIR
jgi:DNA-binding NtrC family response regulator